MVILRDLPEGERDDFLAQYREALETARDRGESGIPAEKVFPGWNEPIAAARAARA